MTEPSTRVASCTASMSPKAPIRVRSRSSHRRIFYGTTSEGGAEDRGPSSGSIPPETHDHAQLHRCRGCALFRRSHPATNGDFYGTTTDGGFDGLGTIFRIDPQGALMTMRNLTWTMVLILMLPCWRPLTAASTGRIRRWPRECRNDLPDRLVEHLYEATLLQLRGRCQPTLGGDSIHCGDLFGTSQGGGGPPTVGDRFQDRSAGNPRNDARL